MLITIVGETMTNGQLHLSLNPDQFYPTRNSWEKLDHV